MDVLHSRLVGKKREGEMMHPFEEKTGISIEVLILESLIEYGKKEEEGEPCEEETST